MKTIRTLSRVLVVAVAALLVVLLSRCTNENTYITRSYEEQTRFNGSIYAWYCENMERYHKGGPSRWNGLDSEFNEPLKLTLVRDNGFSSWFETDDSACFTRFVSAGTYKLIIETGFLWPPDTIYNLHLLPGDTSLEFRIPYTVYDPIHIAFYFPFSSLDDTIGAQYEYDAILRLNSMTREAGQPPMLAISSNTPPDHYRTEIRTGDPWTPSILYTVPIRRIGNGSRTFNVMEVFAALQRELDNDTNNVLPDNLYTFPVGAYPCLFQRYQSRTDLEIR